MTDTSKARADPCFAPWTTPFGLPPFRSASRREHHRPAFEPASRAQSGEIEAIAGDAAAPSFANTIAALGARRPRASPGRGACSATSPAATPPTRCRRSSARSRRVLARHRQRDLPERGAVRAASTRCRRERDALGLDAEQARVLERYHTHFVRAGAAARRRGEGAPRRDQRAARDARHAVRPERARRREGLYAGRSRARPTSPACRTSLRGRGRARRRGARPGGQARHHAVALARSSRS